MLLLAAPSLGPLPVAEPSLELLPRSLVSDPGPEPLLVTEPGRVPLSWCLVVKMGPGPSSEPPLPRR
jgi:hypothetical protein